jgi:hypothetical protein
LFLNVMKSDHKKSKVRRAMIPCGETKVKLHVTVC